MLKKLFHFGPPDVQDLLQKKDLTGLIRALQDTSPDVVRDAARAIASLHQHGDEAMRQQAGATAPALLEAYYRVCGNWNIPATAKAAGYALIEALGEIRAVKAGQLLSWIISNGNYESADRKVAVQAKLRLPVPFGGAAMVAQLLGYPPNTGVPEAAAAGLVGLGDVGLIFLRNYLLNPYRRLPRGAAGKALEDVIAAGGIHAAAARAILNELDAADHEAERQRAKEAEAVAKEREAQEKKSEAEAKEREAKAKEREAKAKEREAKEPAMRPVAMMLAGLMGHPEWVVDGWTIKPGPRADDYRDALALCRRLGLPVDEHEEIQTLLNQDASVQWANVEFEGESFLIDGGRQMYFGNEW